MSRPSSDARRPDLDTMTPADRRITDAVTDIVHDATVLDATCAAALTQLGQSVGGYPATTPGARPPEIEPPVECHHPDCTNTLPCEIHEPAVNLTGPERLAGRRDKATFDRRRLTKLTHRVRRDIAELAALTQRWGTGGIDNHTVRERLNDALSTVWCINCAEHGYSHRRTNGDYCEFCSGIKSKYKRYPNAQLCAMNDIGRRVMPSDVVRAFKAKEPAVPAPRGRLDTMEDARARRGNRVGNAHREHESHSR